MKTRFILTVIIGIVLVLVARQPASAVDEELGIGSKAPSLNIEHWIQDGNGFFKPVEKFTKGNVYVVEFWATWCPPCVASMPHLAELQNKYRGRKVQIISVSDESLDDVQGLLERENEEEGKTFDEITSAYSLTTDPDRSVYVAYMDAAGQQGIPTSFIVGKSGRIEWIGHPMELDEPLEAVVEDTWDREAFKEEIEAQKQFELAMRRMSMLAGAGKFEQALELVDDQIKSVKSDATRDHWTSVRYSLLLSSGQIDDEVIAYYRTELGKMKGDAQSVTRFGYSLYGIIEQGGDAGPLATDAIKAIEAEVDGVEDVNKPLLFNTVALLNDAIGNLKEAIAAQESAIEVAVDERRKKRLQPYLDELQEKAEKKADGK